MCDMTAPEAGRVPGGVQRPDDPLLDGQPAVAAPLQPRLPALGALVAALGTHIMLLYLCVSIPISHLLNMG